ncbi:unnamed protein product [Moneuplotes crassus]|uniref:Uncharacterized protein n=1 Tax=Euplotes crassus TaxID=5936 RepID=A0AAD1XKP8_EUPCR|nr:unnamed protein product [Moneuplotes crassus]
MTAPKTKLGKTFERLYKYTEGKHNKFLQKHQEMKDMIENREFLGADKYGNQYFQYFNYHGLPTRRRVYYKFHSGNRFHVDVHFIDWLYRRKALPPNKYELEQLYLEDEERAVKAIEWDRMEDRKQIKYRNKLEAQKQLGMTPQQMQLQTLEQQNSKDEITIEEFEPIPWEVVKQTRTELKKYLPPEDHKQQLIAVEEGILEEHDKYQKYLEGKGKDFDNIAFTKMAMQVYGVRKHYEDLQKFGYIKEDVTDPSQPISVREARKKFPKYAKEYMDRPRERMEKHKKKIQQQIDKVKQNEEKYRRYYNFKQKFRDVFDELEEIKQDKDSEEIDDIEMTLIGMDEGPDKRIV